MLGIISSVFGSVAKVTGTHAVQDDDMVDRLNHVITVAIFSLFAIFVTTKQFAGDPIKCISSGAPGDYKDYMHAICWIKNTYRHTWTPGGLPEAVEDREAAEIKYYQWVPIILMMQCLMFKFPNIFWKSLNGQSGVNLKKIAALAEQTQIGEMDQRMTTIKHIAQNIARWLMHKRERHASFVSRLRSKIARIGIMVFFLGQKSGTYLVGLYMFTKLLYLVNVIAQFFILNRFLSEDFSLYGIEIINFLRAEGELKDSVVFPKVTFCDFKHRQLANINTYTAQCVLSINLFTEKIFIFIWFWLFVLAIFTGFSFFFWCYKVIFRKNRVQYVEKYLSLMDRDDKTGKQMKAFVDHYLRDDGVFLLRVVSNNSTPLVMQDLLTELWASFQTTRLYRHIQEDDIEDQPTKNHYKDWMTPNKRLDATFV